MNKLSDAYVKFFRWATDRLAGRDGIVCFVSNNSFIDLVAFDGMRQHLEADFSVIWHLDLHGNVRKNPRLSGTTHNVFGIQVGVGITLAVRMAKAKTPRIWFHRVPETWRRAEKCSWLSSRCNIGGVKWSQIVPDDSSTWLIPVHAKEYSKFSVLSTREAKASRADVTETIFKLFSIGLNSSRDSWVYAFSRDDLCSKVKRIVDTYNGEVDRLRRAKKPVDIDSFVTTDEKRIKWSSRLKETLNRGLYADFDESKIRRASYRPFTSMLVYFDAIPIHRLAQLPTIFPNTGSEHDNVTLVAGGYGRKAFSVLTTLRIPDLNYYADPVQCCPFYVYDEDRTHRRENVTDWALEQFRTRYEAVPPQSEPPGLPRRKTRGGKPRGSQEKDGRAITKWDIFYYVYGILHHPGYRTKFADNLKRELPRIPFAPDFWAFADAGRELAKLHLDYEKLKPWDLDWIEAEDEPLSYRVEKMKLSKDKTSLRVNDSLTLAGIPPEVFEYRLGNRSALEWVIDQYQVSEDKRSGIRSDPNRPDDEEYIVRLVGQVVRVSVETVKIVKGLPAEFS